MNDKPDEMDIRFAKQFQSQAPSNSVQVVGVYRGEASFPLDFDLEKKREEFLPPKPVQ